ncbi:MAG TPA: hypothetical protein VGF56_11235 [Rhizomicrobium sp.]
MHITSNVTNSIFIGLFLVLFFAAFDYVFFGGDWVLHQFQPGTLCRIVSAETPNSYLDAGNARYGEQCSLLTFLEEQISRARAQSHPPPATSGSKPPGVEQQYASSKKDCSKADTDADSSKAAGWARWFGIIISLLFLCNVVFCCRRRHIHFFEWGSKIKWSDLGALALMLVLGFCVSYTAFACVLFVFVANTFLAKSNLDFSRTVGLSGAFRSLFETQGSIYPMIGILGTFLGLGITLASPALPNALTALNGHGQFCSGDWAALLRGVGAAVFASLFGTASAIGIRAIGGYLNYGVESDEISGHEKMPAQTDAYRSEPLASPAEPSAQPKQEGADSRPSDAEGAASAQRPPSETASPTGDPLSTALLSEIKTKLQVEMESLRFEVKRGREEFIEFKMKLQMNDIEAKTAKAEHLLKNTDIHAAKIADLAVQISDAANAMLRAAPKPGPEVPLNGRRRKNSNLRES